MNLLITIAAAVVAPVEIIDCPATHQGIQLIGASMYAGRQMEAELMGSRKKVNGGMNVDYGFSRGDVKWVACWYKPATPLWYQISPAATRCNLIERNVTSGKVRATVRCKYGAQDAIKGRNERFHLGDPFSGRSNPRALTASPSAPTPPPSPDYSDPAHSSSTYLPATHPD